MTPSRNLQRGVGPQDIAVRPRWKSITQSLASDLQQVAPGVVVEQVINFSGKTKWLSDVIVERTGPVSFSPRSPRGWESSA